MVEYSERYHKGSPTKEGATIVVYGYDPIPGQLDPVVKHFSEQGDVFEYIFQNEVITSGELDRLPRLVGDITLRVAEICFDYGIERVRTVGASLGAAIAMNVQDRLELTTPGIYGAAGVTLANNFMLNPVFKYHGIPKVYKEKGHTLGSVREAWREIDLQEGRKMGESMRFWANASVFDPVVWYPIAKQNFKPYVTKGTCKLQRSTALLHTATINEMANHIAEATEIADSIPAK